MSGVGDFSNLSTAERHFQLYQLLLQINEKLDKINSSPLNVVNPEIPKPQVSQFESFKTVQASNSSIENSIPEQILVKNVFKDSSEEQQKEINQIIPQTCDNFFDCPVKTINTKNKKSKQQFRKSKAKQKNKKSIKHIKRRVIISFKKSIYSVLRESTQYRKCLFHQWSKRRKKQIF